VKIVITGATGYVGRNLVPLLQESGADMLLAGRDKAKINRVFPGCAYCDYTELAETAKGYTVLLHLAVLNNTSSEPLETFLEVNVDGALETAKLARKAGIETFVNFSSTHALDQSNTSPYAISKRKAADSLAKVEGIRIVNLYLPYVYNPDFSDRLTFLAKLPSPLARIGFGAIASLKPIVSIHRIAQLVRSLDSREFFCSGRIGHRQRRPIRQSGLWPDHAESRSGFRTHRHGVFLVVAAHHLGTGEDRIERSRNLCAGAGRQERAAIYLLQIPDHADRDCTSRHP
jgi:nucleoside-diphosphate-sugar epimerase